MRVFLDSSALVKRYIDEADTETVLNWCEQASELAIAVIAVPELVSAFCRTRREGRLSETQYVQIKSDLMADIADVLICEITPQVVQRAITALEDGPLRGMDALHVGAALTCAADVFISADARQCAAAERFGVKVVRL
jgi:predicted nucleic acid-binding protein